MTKILLKHIVEKRNEKQLADILLEGTFVEEIKDEYDRINYIFKLSQPLNYTGNFYSSSDLNYLRIIPDGETQSHWETVCKNRIIGLAIGAKQYSPPYKKMVDFVKTIEHHCFLNP